MSIEDFVKTAEAAGALHTRRDAVNLTAFIEQELRYVSSKNYARVFTTLNALEFIPLATGIPPNAMSWSYSRSDKRGSADWLAALGDDMPRVDVSRDRVNLPIHTFAVAYGYSLEEIEAARFAGVPLSEMKAEAARRACAEFENRVLLYGEPKLGLQGLLTSPEIPRVSAANGSWRTSATNDQIVSDLSAMVDQIYINSAQTFAPNTLVLPPIDFRAIQTRRLSNTVDTVHDFFLRTNGFIKNISWLRELETAGPGGTPTALLYMKDPSVLEAIIPMPFQELPVQTKNLELVVPCRERIGGIAVYQPMAMTYIDSYT